jgi:KDO2-lipid IV(A) lauroyltransferase
VPGSADVAVTGGPRAFTGRVLLAPVRAAAAVVAWGLAVLVGDVLRIRRAHAEAAMARAGIADPGRTARAMYRSLGRGLVELVAMAFSEPERRLAPSFPWVAVESLASAGGGAVIATAHTGSWDSVACAVAARMPLTVVTKRLSVVPLNAFWQRLRAGQGLQLVEVGSAAGSAARALRRGGLVAMMIDQAPERARGAIRVSFLGEQAWVDLAPALCALRSRAPLVVAFPRRLENGTNDVEIAAVLTPPLRARRAWAVEATVEATKLLEAFIRRNPDQWLWMHRRWKDATPRRANDHLPPRLAGARP